MILLFTLVYFSWMNDAVISFLSKLLLLFVNIAGCYIAYTLIKQEKFQINRSAQRFCKMGKHVDCFQVTRSNYSKFFGWLSWAELGMAYFLAVTLWVAIAPISSQWILPLGWLLLLPLPFTLWSLYTQAFLIRKWCLFCCTIVFILWLNALILYFIFPLCNILPNIESLLAALLLLTCTAVVLYISKTKSTIDPYLEERQMARIKYNVPIIRSQLSETNYETRNIGLTWGDPQSSHEIILYISVGCSHCGKAVKE
ncbi:vitamin K epoxide reductase family protein [Bacteroides bouchesdurhonensis]|uniref:vitamin K epoxide reductase family protein n=1 Tax=Bacteroides bouchesdurhonensis TaxID=1841855 RepID=UPI001652646E|nr:vitamin K epoxide reductase family protein [Bacteroides bouchesdurhonensis]